MKFRKHALFFQIPPIYLKISVTFATFQSQVSRTFYMRDYTLLSVSQLFQNCVVIGFIFFKRSDYGNLVSFACSITSSLVNSISAKTSGEDQLHKEGFQYGFQHGFCLFHSINRCCEIMQLICRGLLALLIDRILNATIIQG